jgi:hypothetical protein
VIAGGVEFLPAGYLTLLFNMTQVP